MINKPYSEYKDVFILSFISIIAGIIIGIIDTVFGKVLIEITEFRDANPLMLIPFLSIAGIFIIYTYSKIGKNSIKGMSLIFESVHGEEEGIPKRLVPLVMLTTWITHLFGGSAGREGVAVQIGATVADIAGSRLKIKNAKKIMLITGMAAGFAGLFQTPIAAVFFALEVLTVGIIEYKALIPSVVASFTASFTSHFLGLEKFSFNLNSSIEVTPDFIFKMILIGIIFGIVGGAFAHFLSKGKKYLSYKIENPIKRIFIIGIFLSIVLLLLHMGRYSGLGTNLISKSFNGEQIYNYDWILKFILTIITLSAGFQGGEVTPLFSIGASLGVVLALVLGMPVEFVAALGYAAVFGSATNTFLAPIFIGAEVFGYQYMPYFFIICTIAYFFNGSKSIYAAQKNLEQADNLKEI